MRTALVFACVLTIAAPGAAAQTPAQHEHPAPEQLGRVHFETSCSKEVTDAFDRAIALLHSFAFSAAKQAFEGVLAKDPSCAMAHWGIAMTHWGNPFAGLRSAKALVEGETAVSRRGVAGSRDADVLHRLRERTG